jgi:hypothetical protein
MSIIAAIVFGLVLFGGAQAQPSPQQEIASAVLALPEHMRAAATVVRLNRAGFLESLRKGTNGMVCMADRQGDDTFDVRCYREDFISVVYRGFQLSAEGVRGEDLTNRIEAEIKAEKLKLPRQPTAGYRCLGPSNGYDASKNSLNSEIRCWQSVHFPFQTAHDMGLLDEKEIPDGLRSTMPYVMSSGRYWAHVMIEHPAAEAKSEHPH